MDLNFNIAGEYIFRGIEYRIAFCTVNKPEPCLSIEVEDKITGDQWKGIFDSSYIEELTHKTGNFKQFDVFLSMLESALDKSTDSVTLDLLTFTDLELLRNRKAVSGGYQGKNKSRPASKQQENKRYLILIYSVEFDRIHYPLPLPYLGKPDPVHLQNLVRQLNEEISQLKCGKSSRSHEEAFLRLKKDYDALLEEKQGLEETLMEIKEDFQKNGKTAVSKEVRILKRVVQNLELEMMKEKNRFQRAISKKSTEVKRLNNELSELSARERTLQIRVKSLTNELALYKRSRTPVTTSSINRNSRDLQSRSEDRFRLRSSLTRSGSRSTSFNQRRSNSYDRQPPSGRERSSSRGKQVTVPKSSVQRRSRTPTPNRFTRFDPTLYNEERKRKLRDSQERLKRRTPGYRFESGDARGRSKSRTASSLRSALRNRSGSLESRNSSDNGSITRRNHAWGTTPDHVTESHRLSSTPNIFTHRKGGRTLKQKRTVSNDPDIDEIDARLEALQQYMEEIEKK